MLTFDYEGGGGVQGHDYVIMSLCEKVVKKTLQKNFALRAFSPFQNFDGRNYNPRFVSFKPTF